MHGVLLEGPQEARGRLVASNQAAASAAGGNVLPLPLPLPLAWSSPVLVSHARRVSSWCVAATHATTLTARPSGRKAAQKRILWPKYGMMKAEKRDQHMAGQNCWDEHKTTWAWHGKEK